MKYRVFKQILLEEIYPFTHQEIYYFNMGR